MKIKLLLLLLVLTIFKSSGQEITYDKAYLKETLPKWAVNVLDIVKFEKEYVIIDYIKPFCLEYDFNGDLLQDVAILIKEKETNKKGILIIHNKSKLRFILGAGEKFYNGGDDFNWMDNWNIYRQKIAHETIFNKELDIVGENKIRLDYSPIQVSSNEGAPNLICWNSEKYIWIHTGD